MPSDQNSSIGTERGCGTTAKLAIFVQHLQLLSICISTRYCQRVHAFMPLSNLSEPHILVLGRISISVPSDILLYDAYTAPNGGPYTQPATSLRVERQATFCRTLRSMATVGRNSYVRSSSAAQGWPQNCHHLAQ